jgi:hypothetical protein
VTTERVGPDVLRPRTRRAGAVAVLAALTLAAGGAAAGSWLGWRTAGPLITNEQARALTAELVPGAPAQATERHDVLFGYENPADAGTWFFGNDDYNAGWVEITLPWNASGTTVDALRASLGVRGWDVTGADGPSLQANRGDVVVDVEAAGPHGPAGPQPEATLTFQRTEPPAAALGTLLGAVLGLLTGWGAGLPAVSRRRGGVATAAALVLLPVSLLVLLDQVLSRFGPDAGLISPDSGWWPYLTFPYQACTLVGGTLALITALLTAIPRGDAGRPKPQSA